MALSLEGTNPTPGDDHRLTSIRCDGSQMDLPQVNSCMAGSRRSVSLWDLDTHMQLKAVIPDQGTRTAVCRQVKRQHQRRAAFAHGKHDASLLPAHSLCRPGHGIEALGFVGVAHAHLRMCLSQLPGGLDVGEEGMDDHLNRLAMKGKASLRGFLKFVSSRPFLVMQAGGCLKFHTAIPHTRRFQLRITQASQLRW